MGSDMAVIVMAARKGGTGKTLQTASLSVLFDRMLRARWKERMSRDRPPDVVDTGPEPPEPDQVVVVDLDPQGCLTAWHNRRLGLKGPTIVQSSAGNLRRELGKLRHAGVKVVLVDTPPGHSDLTERAMAAATVTVIPAKPGQHDLDATLATVAMTLAIGARFVVAPNDGTYRSVSMGDLVKALRSKGLPMLPPVHHRVDLMLSGGRTATERWPNTPAARELEQAFLELVRIIR